MDYKIMFVLSLVVTFVLTVLISRKLIPALKSRKMGQKILDIGPRWHKSKEGTPTMGGLAFIAASLVSGIGCSVYLWLSDGYRAALPLIFTLALGLAGGLIGMIDDAAKLRNKRNEGLTAPQKFLLQLIAASLYLLGMALVLKPGTSMRIPFTGYDLELGFFYYVISLVIICGMLNSVNLTDGIDGLASSVTAVVGVFFTVAAFVVSEAGPDAPRLALGSILIGACGGFKTELPPGRVLFGGPVMGIPLSRLDLPVCKNSGAVTALSFDMV
ncbi:MAG: hypothetical protein MJ096_01765, partial [Clostridia bacterium]|nr:hypothetical protein [Clostridia bacterium]